jgi:hypothetical protein
MITKEIGGLDLGLCCLLIGYSYLFDIGFYSLRGQFKTKSNKTPGKGRASSNSKPVVVSIIASKVRKKRALNI